MLAEQALLRSENQLIMVDTLRGLVTIYQEATGRTDDAEAFQLRFVPRDRRGQLNAAETIAGRSLR